MLRRSTWVMLAVFAIVLTGAYLWSRKEAEKPPEATPTPAPTAGGLLFKFTGPIKQVRLERVGGASLELTADEQGGFQITYPAGLQSDPQAAGEAVAQLAALATVSRLIDIPPMSTMGLDPPAYRLVVTTTEDQQSLVSVGRLTPTQSGYYILSSDRNVYIVSTYALDPLLQLIDSPPVLPTPTSPAMDGQVYPYPSGETPVGTP